MKYLIAITLMCLSLTGCYSQPNPNATHVYVDGAKRHEYFQECLKNLPVGPEQTHYNDWDEVVDSCEASAYHQALITSNEVEAAKHSEWVLYY